ncbi:MAG: D-aminoacyl-tRNA deacylase [Bacillota bacterium]
MIAVIQRVSEARVVVAGEVIGQIRAGMLALVAVHAEDTAEDIQWMTGKLTSLRIFRNGEKHFDLDVRQVNGGILLVSNFTVAGQTRKGRRPSLDAAASPEQGAKLFDELVRAVQATGIPTATGRFGADMQVSLTNDGPVTFIVDSRKNAGAGE